MKLRSAFVIKEKGGQEWICPGCGGDCFGSSGMRYYCQGKSLGTETEQVGGCGYFEDWTFLVGAPGSTNGSSKP